MSLVRVTMFKIAKKEDREKLASAYEVLKATQKKEGKPYIVNLQAGEAYDDTRSQGYTFIAKSEFKTKEDMDYYDTECEAHKVLKTKAKDLNVEGILTVYYHPTIVHAA
ncbi:hypothetical protein F5884DRAFT_749999 [Xylogone sp. PMI_703]|nr:hypothetical protein F5884DRAFT_749999 [Xylogone sp. PMI_703]